MADVRTEVNGSFQLSSFADPTDADHSATNICAKAQAVKARGKGSITITAHSTMGAVINITEQLSSDVEKTVYLVVVNEDSGQSTVINDLNKAVSGNETFYCVNLAAGDSLTKLEANTQGKLESATVNGTELLVTACDLLHGLNDQRGFTSQVPAGFSVGSELGGSNQARYDRAIGSTYGVGTNYGGEVKISAPGRGHLGIISV